VPDEITQDWVSFLGVVNDESTAVDDTIGFRRFFEKDRQLLNTLVSSAFDNTLELFRSRRKKLPVKVWRAYRGIRTNTAGDTAYGPQNPNENTTTQPVPLQGFSDWFTMPATFESLTDGRLGFQASVDGRFNKEHRFENQNIITPVGSGNPSSPATWNGVFRAGLPDTDARSYEMMMTIALRVDEDLFEYIAIPNTGTRSIKTFGPPLELMRDGSAEYRYEEAKHSVIELSTESTGKLARPPIKTATPQDDLRKLVYRDDRPEISARAQLLANRFSGGDIESQVHLPGINEDFWAGQFLSRITEADQGDTSGIEIGSIIDVVQHDFVAQETILHLATVR